MHCQLSRLPLALLCAHIQWPLMLFFLLWPVGLMLFSIHITVLYPSNTQCALWGLYTRGWGAMCCWGCKAWQGLGDRCRQIVSALPRYHLSPEQPAPRAHEVPASGQYVQDLWGKFSPNPLPHFLTEEGADLVTLMYAPSPSPCWAAQGLD